jgi:spore coat polysaccharide biosynthesis protein SpsF
MTAKPIGIVVARLDSRRLASKALVTVDGKPLVQYVIDRALRVPSLAGVTVATTARPVDDPLADYARGAGVAVFRGPTDNVAERLVMCARRHEADFFVRLNADSPFADPGLIEEGLQRLFAAKEADLVSNLPGRTYPYGISVEIVNVSTLERILPTLNEEEAEHVTRRFYDQPAGFRIERLVCAQPQLRRARLVVDTEDDLARFRALVRRLGPRASTARFDEVAELALAGDRHFLEQR